MKRRQLIQSVAALGAIPLASNAYESVDSPSVQDTSMSSLKHSVCRWCYGRIPLEEFADRCKDMGLQSIELLSPGDWDTVLSRGLEIAISNGSSLGITRGFNDPSNHAQLLADFTEIVPKAADKGIPQVICFSGNRDGMDEETGLENCARGLEPVVKMAEEHGVMIIMELLNSKVDHKDYMCDHTSWGVRLVEKVGSPNFKLLYDIYHMQIMEGDVIRTIRDHKDFIAHYHTGGVPGRNEINDSQELYYPAIMKAIAETGFKGFVAQEFIPTRPDVFESLEEGVKICDL